MIHTIYSNYYEILQEFLLQNIGHERKDVFATHRIIIPSMAVRDRMRAEIARRQGVCAGCSFQFIGDWFKDVTRVESANEHTSQSLVWPVWKILSDRSFTSAHQELQHYIQGKSPSEIYDFAVRLSAVFRRYIAYRFDWVLEWTGLKSAGAAAQSAIRQNEAGALAAHGDYAWQRAIWERLADPAVWPDVARLHELPVFFNTGVNAAGDTVHIFMPTVVQPLFLPFISALASGGADIWLYVKNPCAGFWFENAPYGASDDAGENLLAYLSRNAGSTRATIDRLWRFLGEDEQGKDLSERLLEESGKQITRENDPALGREGEIHPDFDFAANRIQDFQAGAASDALRCYVRPAPGDRGSMLARVQDALLQLDPAQMPSRSDESIRIVKAPNRLREVQALCDYLQKLFHDNRGLKAGDVLVATPGLDEYIPLIDGVFGSLPREQAIPYRIAGAGLQQQNRATEAVIALGDMLSGRADSEQFFDWLEMPIVTRHWGLEFTDLSVLRGWLRAAGYRYGICRAHMARLGPDAARDAEGCLESALRRLALGFMQNAGHVRLFAGEWLPVSAASPSDYETVSSRPELLQKLMLIGEKLRQAWETLPAGGGIAIEDWSGAWSACTEDLFGDEVETPELVGMRRTVNSILRMMRESLGEDAALDFSVFWHALKGQLTQVKQPVKLSDAVTFADMSHSRGLPFRVVAVLGLGRDSQFPGSESFESFDLMSLENGRGEPVRRRCDRDSRADNRNVFLDLLLAARGWFYASYCTGEGAKATRQPSPVLEDFEKLLVLAVPDADRKDFLSGLTAQIPLTAESCSNFLTGQGRFWRSHSAGLLASVKAATGLAEEPPFADAGPSVATGQWPGELDYADLERFWIDPDDWMMRRHGLPRNWPSVGDMDLPIVPGASKLDSWAWRKKVADLFDSGIAGDELKALLAHDPLNGAEGLREVFARDLVDWLAQCPAAAGTERTVAYPLAGAMQELANAGSPIAAGPASMRQVCANLETDPSDGSHFITVRAISSRDKDKAGLRQTFLCASGVPVRLHVHYFDGKDNPSWVEPVIPAFAAMNAMCFLAALYLLALARPAPAPVAYKPAIQEWDEAWRKMLWRGREPARSRRQNLALVAKLRKTIDLSKLDDQGLPQPKAHPLQQELIDGLAAALQEVRHA